MAGSWPLTPRAPTVDCHSPQMHREVPRETAFPELGQHRGRARAEVCEVCRPDGGSSVLEVTLEPEMLEEAGERTRSCL